MEDQNNLSNFPDASLIGKQLLVFDFDVRYSYEVKFTSWPV